MTKLIDILLLYIVFILLIAIILMLIIGCRFAILLIMDSIEELQRERKYKKWKEEHRN